MTVKLLNEGNIRLLCNIDDWIPWNVYIHGRYQIEKRYESFMQGAARGSSVIFDVGANIGYYTTQFSRLLGENRLAVGSSSHRAILSVTEAGGDADFYVNPANYNGAAGNQDQEVFVTTLDEWSQSNNIERIDFIKLDCEGSELHALFGGKQLLERSENVLLVCECNPEALARQGHSPSQMFSFLEELGFKIGMLDDNTKKFIFKIPYESFNGNFLAIKGQY